MMALRAIPCVLLLAVCTPPESPAGPAGSTPSQPSSWTFNTPPLAESDELRVELLPGAQPLRELVIDGHVTGVRLDPNFPPRIDATGDGRYLLYGRVGLTAADYSLFVWEPSRARLTELGSIGRVSVPPLGVVFVRDGSDGQTVAIYELSPIEPRLAPIWTADPTPATILGAHRGALLLLEGTSTFTWVRDSGAPVRREIALGDWTPHPHPTFGGFDDGRLLLARPLTPAAADGSDPGSWELAVLDVERSEIISLGSAPGSWTATGISWPAPPIASFVDDLDAHLDGAPGLCVTAVRRSDLALRTRCP